MIYMKGCDIVNLVEKITKAQIRTDLPEFRVGDTVKVDVKIIEGKRERIQSFEGIVIKIVGGGISKTFTVRKISSGVGVERTFPFNSPKIESVTMTYVMSSHSRKSNYGLASLAFLFAKE